MIGDGILQQPLNKFKHWAVNLSVMIPLGRALHSEQTEVWIYPAPFCAMRFVNDGRERNEDGTVPAGSSAQHATLTNAELHEPKIRPTPSHLLSYTNVSIVALDNIPAHSEIFVNYGDKFNKF